MSLDQETYKIPVARSVASLRECISSWRRDGKTIALVPTMGALHKGHLALVEKALAEADKVVVSIFVNPAQFAPGEDFDDYPRTEVGDIEKLHPLGVDLIFGPPAREMYAPDFSTTIRVGSVSEGLCSETRPHFFGGVAVVVAKLLIQCLPDFAIFGEKDYQQLLVIKRMVRDLDIPVGILGCETEREKDGLAISSRNVYLSKSERQTAVALSRTLKDVVAAIKDGEDVSLALKEGVQNLFDAGFDTVDYLEVRDAEDLQPVTQVTKPARVLAAAHLGKTRLIDNFPIG